MTKCNHSYRNTLQTRGVKTMFISMKNPNRTPNWVVIWKVLRQRSSAAACLLMWWEKITFAYLTHARSSVHDAWMVWSCQQVHSSIWLMCFCRSMLDCMQASPTLYVASFLSSYMSRVSCISDVFGARSWSMVCAC